MNEKAKSHSMERIHLFSHYLSKKKHMAGYNNLLTNLLLPIVSIHFSLIILSTPFPPSIALQGHEKTMY